MIKIWLDDVRTPPSDDWIWIKSVNAAKDIFQWLLLMELPR